MCVGVKGDFNVIVIVLIAGNLFQWVAKRLVDFGRRLRGEKRWETLAASCPLSFQVIVVEFINFVLLERDVKVGDRSEASVGSALPLATKVLPQGTVKVEVFGALWASRAGYVS